MLNYREGDFKAGRVNIHYYRTGGDKPPFILLHGATDNGLCWTRTAEMLARDYDVTMPDAQGHGLSDRIGTGFTFEDHTDQVAALIRELGLVPPHPLDKPGEGSGFLPPPSPESSPKGRGERGKDVIRGEETRRKPIIMGHSMGAGTAANLAVKYPSLPGAIILEDPPWGMPQGPVSEEARRQAEAMRSSLIGLRDLPLEEIVKESRKRDPGWSEYERLPWARAKQQFDPSLFSRPAINQRPYTEIVPLITSPTLLVTAENGIVSADVAENAERLWRSKKPFRWVRIMGAGHNIRRERFEEFYQAVEGFLEEIGP